MFGGDSHEEEKVRFVVELASAAGGRVEGSIRRDEVRESVPFSGWLELLRLLEAHLVEAPQIATACGEGSFPSKFAWRSAAPSAEESRDCVAQKPHQPQVQFQTDSTLRTKSDPRSETR